MTDLVCRVPNRFIPASFQSQGLASPPHLAKPNEPPPQRLSPGWVDSPQSIANSPQVPLNRSLTARRTPRETNSFLQDVNNFWSFNWWRDASGGERALGFGVAILAAVPTVAALGIAGVSSVLGMGCGGTHEVVDAGVDVPPPENHPPVLEHIGDREVVAGDTLEIVLRATDSDRDRLFYEVVGGIFLESTDASLMGNIYRWRVSENVVPSDFPAGFRDFPMTFRVYDGREGGRDSEDINVRVLAARRTPPPPPQNRRPYFTNENSHVELRAGENIRFDFDAVDPDGDSITYSLDRVQYTAPGTDGAPRTVLHHPPLYATYFDRSSGILNVPTNPSIRATYVFTVSARDNRGLSASTELTADLVSPTPPSPPPPPPPPPDRDGDGFRADVDCDDGNASVRPLGSAFNISINSNITICAGNYGQLTISGNGLRVNTRGGAVTLSYLRISDLINSTVDGISVSGRGVGTGAFDPFPSLISISGFGNTFSHLTAECAPTSTSCSGVIMSGSNNNIIRDSAFRNGYTGLWIFSGSYNAVLNNSFTGQSLRDGRPLYYIDAGSRNTFSGNIYR